MPLVLRCSAALAMAVLIAAGLSVPAQAAVTRTVGPGGSIQSAINASNNGDTVQVNPGTYTENVVINGRYINLVGSGAGTTTIRAANGSRAVVHITNVPFAPSFRAKVSGFTITGGDAPGGQGGGITIFNNASPVISDNIIAHNRAASGYGGGILVYMSSNPTIKNNTIASNYARDGGAGVFSMLNSSPVLYQNTITGNWTDGWRAGNGGSSGGGVYFETPAGSTVNPVLIGNTITSNRALFAGGGVMVRTGVNLILEGNTISDNSAAYGGGIHVESSGSSTGILSNTISNNRAIADGGWPGSGYGGGIALYDHSQVTIRGNTITGNSSSVGGAGISSAENASSIVTSNLIKGNSTKIADGGSQDGGGIYIANSSMTAQNNQFVLNEADRGSGIAVLTGGKITANHNTIVKNRAGNINAGSAVFVLNQSAISADFANNIFTLNTGYQVYEEARRTRLVGNLFTAPDTSSPPPSGSGLLRVGGTGYESAAAINGSGNAGANIDTAAGFSNVGADDFTLAAGSTAINAASGALVSEDFRGVIRSDAARDIGAFEFEANPVYKKNVYRFWSESKRGHFYTIGQPERDVVASSYDPREWRYEGIAYEAFDQQIPGTIPLYRFYSEMYQGHFFTADAVEAKAVTDNYPDREWLPEGVAYYVYPLTSAIASRIVYRFWSPDNKHHFYTANEAESQSVQRNFPRNVWTFEGGNFRVSN